jgi:hypothetical protein
MYDKPITLDGLEFIVSRPRLADTKSVKVEFEVRGLRSGTHKLPSPKLKCAKGTFTIDQNAANYPFSLNDKEKDFGTWAWQPRGDCSKGSFKVGKTTFSFDNLK